MLNFCPGGLGKVKSFMHKIDDELSAIIEKTTEITGKIKTYEGDARLQFILALVPQGSAIEGFLNKALDAVTGIEDKAKTFADRIIEKLDGLTEDAKDMTLVKIDSKAVALQHGEKEAQHFYDSAVQIHIENLK